MGVPDYDWQNVGTYYESRQTGRITKMDEDFKAHYQKFSGFSGGWRRCSRDTCEPHEIMIPDTKDLCCWHCVACNFDHRKKSENECERCPPGTLIDTQIARMTVKLLNL